MSGALYAFGFRVPAQYARIIRALITLEGSATALDPDFQVIYWVRKQHHRRVADGICLDSPLAACGVTVLCKMVESCVCHRQQNLISIALSGMRRRHIHMY